MNVHSNVSHDRSRDNVLNATSIQELREMWRRAVAGDVRAKNDLARIAVVGCGGLPRNPSLSNKLLDDLCQTMQEVCSRAGLEDPWDTRRVSLPADLDALDRDTTRLRCDLNLFYVVRGRHGPRRALRALDGAFRKFHGAVVVESNHRVGADKCRRRDYGFRLVFPLVVHVNVEGTAAAIVIDPQTLQVLESTHHPTRIERHGPAEG